MSEVFEATSFSICAPMFSLESLSSISLATVTPSLVIVGLPNFLSITTLRPFGPSVALTAAAMMLMPLSRLARASSSNFSCFGIAHVPPYSRMARTSGRLPPSDFGLRRAPFFMTLDAPKRLPVDSDEHDGLIPCGSVHPDGRCHGFRARCLPHAARHDGLMPRRPIHPGRRSHRSRARIDTLPYPAGPLPLTPARRCLAVAFFEAILLECLDDLLRCRD